eukprot:CAMPEP_0115035824 /NCGR_PEP_ID=MMETSP0216-20121206/41730_1 /TAXON_ID=223996 /ORGANISM="Protocruzia adherens, Strain Boccale" /LENGTH=300 /DNA_ID=CAMNT_0002415481 /DNA_START=151 /DNA_END=1053 /DNA_ORIENTATION=+
MRWQERLRHEQTTKKYRPKFETTTLSSNRQSDPVANGISTTRENVLTNSIDEGGIRRLHKAESEANLMSSGSRRSNLSSKRSQLSHHSHNRSLGGRDNAAERIETDVPRTNSKRMSASMTTREEPGSKGLRHSSSGMLDRGLVSPRNSGIVDGKRSPVLDGKMYSPMKTGAKESLRNAGAASLKIDTLSGSQTTKAARGDFGSMNGNGNGKGTLFDEARISGTTFMKRGDVADKFQSYKIRRPPNRIMPKYQKISPKMENYYSVVTGKVGKDPLIDNFWKENGHVDSLRSKLSSKFVTSN